VCNAGDRSATLRPRFGDVSSGWRVRFDGSGVMIMLGEVELLDPTMYEHVQLRE
jgi:hypothetical protein